MRDLALAPGTEEAFSLLRSHHVSTAIVSLTLKAAVDWFAQRLGADFAVGTCITGDVIDHVWPEDKGRWLQEVATRQGLHQRELAAVGDSGGDREMLGAAGFRVFVGDRLPGIPDVLHMPGADMYEVALSESSSNLSSDPSRGRCAPREEPGDQHVPTDPIRHQEEEPGEQEVMHRRVYEPRQFRPQPRPRSIGHE